MEDKFEKRSHCLYCFKEMEAKYRSKKFCSDKCRVYFRREALVKPEPEIPIDPPVIPEDNVPPELPKKEEPAVVLTMRQRIDQEMQQFLTKKPK